MMRRKYIAVAVTFVLLLASATPARAAMDWVSPTCAVGEITHHHVEIDDDNDVTIRLEGWSSWCTSTQLGRANEQFGLALYTDDGAWLGRLTTYQEPRTAPTPFSYLVDDTASTALLGGPLRAICVAYAPDSRMSCVAVNRLSTAHPPTLASLSTSHTSVTYPIDGPCPSCLR